MIQRTDNLTIAQLLSPENGAIFKVPRYQRQYAWRRREWDDLFDDIRGNDKGYYLGSVIVIDHEGRDLKNKENIFEVIDGQQRLVTISILLSTIYERLALRRSQLMENEDSYLAFLNLKKMIVADKSKTRLVPQKQGNNLDDYRWLVKKCVESDLAGVAKPRNYGNRAICKAHGYFEKRLVELEAQAGEDAVDALIGFLDKVKTISVVYILVNNASDAYMLFETLNNRGIPLTSLDLIKNMLMASTGSDEAKADSYYERWQSLVDVLGDEYYEQERFFRYSYDAFRREVNAPFATEASSLPLGAVATRSNLMAIYERQIKSNAEGCLCELEANASMYAKIITPSLVEGPDLAVALLDLSHVQGAPAYLLLLRLFRFQGELGLTDADLAQVCSFLSRFFIRRNLTDTPPTRDLASMFIQVIEDLARQELRGPQAVRWIMGELVRASASDADFERALRGPIYDDNAEMARYVLSGLAKPSVTKEMHDLWEKGSSGYVWTIEHVLPQGSLNSDWVAMVGGGDEKIATEVQEELVHTLGNLTLTGYNSTLSNRSFVEKRDFKDRHGNYVGFKNGLCINDDLANSSKWDAGAIRRRTDRLVRLAMEAFSLAG